MTVTKGFNALKEYQSRTPSFDVIIIGSGYGGSIAAHQLSRYQFNGQNKALNIAILERGRFYAAGQFPATFSELPGHVCISAPGLSKPLGNPDALVDIRLTRDMTVVQGSGVGGGSLVNAGVMIQPDDGVFSRKGWPKAIQQDQQRTALYRVAKALLGANALDLHAVETVPKADFMQALSQGVDADHAAYTEISVAMQDGNGYRACTLCGDCATGCNHNAKMSLDRQIIDKLPDTCQLFTEVKAVQIQKIPQDDPSNQGGDARWAVIVEPVSRELHASGLGPVRLTCHILIVAAGTLGSTELLMRSVSETLRFSPRLGKRFSGNGDSLVVGWRHNPSKRRVNAVADDAEAPDQRMVGPTITRFIKVQAPRNPAEHYMIQEMAVPAALRRLFLEVFTTVDTIDGLSDKHSRETFPYVQKQDAELASIFAVMGNDGAEGELVLSRPNSKAYGNLEVVWPGASSNSLYQDQVDSVAALVKKLDADAKVFANPMWRIGTASSPFFSGLGGGTPITVHPLGGCAMGDDCETGVVDHGGRVFDPAGAAEQNADRHYHEGLYVLDGSIIPCALNANPALTIAMLALRATELMLKQDRNLIECQTNNSPDTPKRENTDPPASPPIRKPAAVSTMTQFKEQLIGDLILDVNGRKRYRAELTLVYEPKSLAELFSEERVHRTLTLVDSKLKVTPSSLLTLQPVGKDGKLQGDPISVPVDGNLVVLERRGAPGYSDRAKVILAAVENRFLRDFWRALARKKAGVSGNLLNDFWGALKQVVRFSRFAAEQWEFQYNLQVDAKDLASKLPIPALKNNNAKSVPLEGKKVVTYGRYVNPWRQMTEMRVTQFPGLIDCRVFHSDVPGGHHEMDNVLSFDTGYAARKDIPLFKITQQQDFPAAWLDVVSLILFVARVVIRTHIWSFRRPDFSDKRVVRRLAGTVKVTGGEIEPLVTWISVGQNTRSAIRMSHYPNPKAKGRPVLLIHGYSASGNTFTYPMLKRSLAGYLWDHGRDVWVVDLRTSSGLSSRNQPWTFEQVASEDVYEAIEYVHVASGRQRVDVVAHCMGAAMLSMCILDAGVPKGKNAVGHTATTDSERVKTDVAEMLGNIVLSQVGPVMQFSMGNRFRAYLFDYLLAFVGSTEYRFHVKEYESALISMLDLLLATVPYSNEEYKRENPFPFFWRKTPWVGSRHRMDMLYGRTYESANVPREVLDHIDDLFGPLNLKTLSQVIHFSRNGVICDSRGLNRYVSSENIRRKWTFNTLYMVGERNGLIDPVTADNVQDLFAGLNFVETRTMPGFGHQDMLIGIGSENESTVFGAMLHFLDKPPLVSPLNAGKVVFRALNPKAGPIFEPVMRPPNGDNSQSELSVRLGAPEAWGRPGYIATFPVPFTDQTPITLYKVSCGFDAWLRGRLKIRNQTGACDMALLLIYGVNHLSRRQGGITTMQLSPSRVTAPTLSGRQEVPTHEQTGSAEPDQEDFSILDDNSELQSNMSAVRKAISDFLNNDGKKDGLCTIKVPASNENNDQLHFAFGSCQYPRTFLDSDVVYASWRYLAESIRHETRFDLVLLLGDQIYIDATAGYFDPELGLDVHAKHYHGLFSAPQVITVLSKVPSLMMLDDHEIADNWFTPEANSPRERESLRLREVGVKSYRKYQRGFWSHYTASDDLWFSFELNGFAFFVMDTRTERDGPHRSINDRRLMSEAQEKALDKWLSESVRKNDLFKPLFIASASMFIPRSAKWQDGRQPDYVDNWSGYPKHQHWLLQRIYELRLQNVLFLSGDEHLSCYAEGVIYDTGKGVSEPQKITFHSIHSSALYAPFPFANSKPHDFIKSDSFSVGGNRLQCDVKAQFMPGDGFRTVELKKCNNGWILEMQRVRCGGTSPQAPFRLCLPAS